ncbi:hypothetical protein GYA54_04690 [Candidatus Kuenenbacteria bacterium]|nr:hypothetical protein [Candidatus Kuenenbacteria bacterium]
MGRSIKVGYPTERGKFPQWERDHEDEITRNSGFKVVGSESKRQKVEDPYKEIQKKVVPNTEGMDRSGPQRVVGGNEFKGDKDKKGSRRLGHFEESFYRGGNDRKERRTAISMKENQSKAYEEMWERDSLDGTEDSTDETDDTMETKYEEEIAEEIREYGDIGEEGEKEKGYKEGGRRAA